MNKGGFAMWYDATFVVTFGNISNAGTSKIKAIKDGKQVEFAKRTNLQIIRIISTELQLEVKSS